MIRIQLFGAIDLRDGGGRELGEILAQPKRLALLSYLAAAFPVGPQRRDTLLGIFWPDLDQDHARNALSKAVHFLRRSLGDATIVSRGGEELALDESLIWVDVRAFRTALEGARLSEALDLYHGDLLPSFFVPGCPAFEDWLERERARLRARGAEAARIQAERHEKERHLTLAVHCARRAVELSEGDERQLRRLIELLDRLGDRAGAVSAYQQFAQKLAAELEVDPAPETVALIERVRSEKAGRPTPLVEPLRLETATSAVERLAAALSGRYTVERRLGAGAMAVVMLAQDLRHHRRVAIKILRPELTALMGPERFLREIEIAAGLMHPHILPLHDSGEAEGMLYYVMPYVEGESLRDRLDRDRQLPMEDALRIAREVADALSYAHGQGFVHRDIKPENILLSGGHALVADFGIARAIGSAGSDQLSARALSGTPAYMSPEQARGERTVDERTDIYALGCVLHEMLAGEPPFTGPSVEAVIARRLSEPAPRVSALREGVHPSVETAIAKSLARDSADRFATAREFADALATAGASARAMRRPSRLRWVGGVAAALLAGVGGWLAWSRSDSVAKADMPHSIAVLPLRSPGDSAGSYFAEGVTEELNGGLVRIQGLAVRPSATVRAEVAKGGDLTELGRRLKAAYVLDGSVRKKSGRIRVNLELVRVDAGATTWSQTYDGGDADIFAIQESVATHVASVLSLQLTSTVRLALARRATTDPVAHDLYLQATHFKNLVTLEGAERASVLYRQAIARDSSFADAWAGLAGAYQLLSQLGGPTPSETQVLLRRAVERAIALDSLNGAAYGELAQVRETFEWDYPAADHGFRRAIALSPGSADAYMMYAQFLNVVGLDDSALAVMRHAVKLSPTDAFRVANLAPRLRMAGRPAEAAAEARRALALDSGTWVAHLVLAQLADDQGRVMVAVHEAERARRIAGDLPFLLGTLGRYYGHAGRRAEAESTLARLTELARRQYVERAFRAEGLLGVNDRPGALDALEESARNREPDLPWKLAYGHFEQLRGEPRYGALLERIGILRYRH